MPDEQWASRPGWHPRYCTCVDCQDRRLGKRRHETRPKPTKAPRTGYEWRECRTCQATGTIMGRWTVTPGGRLTRCPTCFGDGWVQVHPSPPLEKPGHKAKADLAKILDEASATQTPQPSAPPQELAERPPRPQPPTPPGAEVAGPTKAESERQAPPAQPACVEPAPWQRIADDYARRQRWSKRAKRVAGSLVVVLVGIIAGGLLVFPLLPAGAADRLPW